MSAASTGFRDPALGPLLDAALAAHAQRVPLYDKLRRVSGLPSPRVNTGLVAAFAVEAARRGAVVDALLAAMCAVEEDSAPYGHVDEIFPILGVAGTGARAAADDKARDKLIEGLEDMACDRRSRVRDGVAHALVAVGLVDPRFSSTLVRWIDDEQPWLLRAVATALVDVSLVSALGAGTLGELVDRILRRIDREHRAGRRHDAFRRALTAIELALPVIVQRHAAVTEVLVAHTKSADEDVTGVIAACAQALAKGRAAEQSKELEAALAAGRKPSRDPRWDRLPGKRGRGR